MDKVPIGERLNGYFYGVSRPVAGQRYEAHTCEIELRQGTRVERLGCQILDIHRRERYYYLFVFPDGDASDMIMNTRVSYFDGSCFDLTYIPRMINPNFGGISDWIVKILHAQLYLLIINDDSPKGDNGQSLLEWYFGFRERPDWPSGSMADINISRLIEDIGYIKGM